MVTTTNPLRHLLSSVPKGVLFSKDLFSFSVSTHAIQLPAKNIATVQKALDKELFLAVPRIKTIIPCPVDKDLNADTLASHRLILMNFDVSEAKIAALTVRQGQLLKSTNSCIVPYTLHIPYDYWTVDELLDAYLPENLQRIGAFETVGHIAHLNLLPEHEPHLEAIGQIILDKNKGIRTVVTKTGEIESQFRVFPMKLIAGEETFITSVSQLGCRFRFDYSKVYWNSRLEGEHARLIALMKPHELVCDIFAGVGPFSVPLAAKRKCLVFANDLNPDSFLWLQENIKLNKIPSVQIQSYNMDGREFIRKAHADLARLKGPSDSTPEFRLFNHYIMNLPASSLQFLDCFAGLSTDKLVSNAVIPRIHCYLFARLNEDPLELLRIAMHAYPLDVVKHDIVLHNVRRVAPTKDMFCVSFNMPLDFLDGSWKTLDCEDHEDPSVRRKLHKSA